MNKTRRDFIGKMVASFGAVIVMVAAPSSAQACIYGTWVVRCRNGHDNTVTEGTCNHYCENCDVKAFSDGEGDVVCPNGHTNHISTGVSREPDKVLQSYKCRLCNKECRRDL